MLGFIAPTAYVLPPGQDSVIEVGTMELLPGGRDDLFTLLLSV